MIDNVLERLTTLFTEGGARFRVLHHEAGDRTSQSVADIRGTELGQGAKALCCTVKGNGVKMHVLGVLPADMQADLSKLAAAVGGRRASLASPDEVMELTGCIFGAVPPVSFHPDLTLICDPTLFTRYDELAFNAGARDVSIIISTEDFKRIVAPRIADFLRDAAPAEAPKA
ncbi:YbaK/EbsC family protein [Sutterella sp.]|uniref:YbaK/EbsC family protein n=1 Tax=Sutterella sp. TaxID=1981025 RepID=UPI0026E0418E|nr:YbaK/EbsC family protein [Sutterella sp.]MDO5530669.1 YbaK/EbsC family protein [Sutterella sp.]